MGYKWGPDVFSPTAFEELNPDINHVMNLEGDLLQVNLEMIIAQSTAGSQPYERPWTGGSQISHTQRNFEKITIVLSCSALG